MLCIVLPEKIGKRSSHAANGHDAIKALRDASQETHLAFLLSIVIGLKLISGFLVNKFVCTLSFLTNIRESLWLNKHF